jgi:hypothetical protein
MRDVTGGCFCGAIEYRATLDESMVGICHCRDCQIFSGSAFRMTGVVAPADFEFVKGTPKYFDKTAASGQVRRMAFCGECGTHLCSVPVDAKEAGSFVSLRLASAREFHQFKPAMELFCAARLPWLSAVDGTAQFPAMPGALEAPST